MSSNQEEFIPVFLFMGFLESGKTTFIQETLEDKRFNSGERTLVIVCEEGIEEYEPSKFPKKGSNVFFRTLNDKNELTEANLSRFVHETNAEKIVVEYNGMWLFNDFMDAMPEDWGVYQVMFFADSSTFMQYNQNMRSLVVDKLNVCELTVFNRFEDYLNVNAFHQVVRGVSRRSEICYEYVDGKVAYDDIEDPLPFDVEAQHIKIEDSDFALWYRDIMEDPLKYDGKTITFKGIAARNITFPKNTFAIGRHIMTCCVEDIQYCWVVAQYDKEFIPRQKHWVTITADIKVQKHKLYKGAGPVLIVKELSDSTPPEKEVATFY